MKNYEAYLKNQKQKENIVWIAIIIALSATIYINFFAPCDLLSVFSSKDIPARCLHYYLK